MNNVDFVAWLNIHNTAVDKLNEDPSIISGYLSVPS